MLETQTTPQLGAGDRLRSGQEVYEAVQVGCSKHVTADSGETDPANPSDDA